MGVPSVLDVAAAILDLPIKKMFLALLSSDALVGGPAKKFSAVTGNTPLTLLAANMTGAGHVVVNLTAVLAGAGTVTTDTAAAIVAAIPNAQVGQTYGLRIVNSSSGAFAWTLVGGTGVTLAGTMTMAQNSWRDFQVTLTSATAVAVQSIGAGGVTGQAL